MHSRPIPGLAPLVALLCACNTAPVLPPEDDRRIEIVGTDLWSGGEVRVVVRHAEAKEEPVAIVLGGEPLEVSRVDDTTFAAALPVHTGTLPIRVEREGLLAVEGPIALHGYLSMQLGPNIAGSLVLRSTAGAPVVLGSSREGPTEVSVMTGHAIRSWPVSMHSLRCGVGVVPGPMPGQVLVRGEDGGGACQPPHMLRSYSNLGLGETGTEVPPIISAGISAVVGPWTAVQGWHDNWGWQIQCAAAPPWSNCVYDAGSGPEEYRTANPRGWVAGYRARRIFPLGIKSALYDLSTGNSLTVLPHADTDQLAYRSAVFSATEDTLYVAATRSFDENGKLVLVRSSTGAVLAEVPVEGGEPIAITLDPERGRVLMLVHNRTDRRLSLRVLSTADHAIVADLVVADATVEAALRGHEHRQLILAERGSLVFLVSTEYVPKHSPSHVPSPMLIARWTLPTES